MSILNLINQLPNTINFEGYTFTLKVMGDYVGYYLTHCHSNKKYKKEAFKMGMWWEKKVTMNTVGSNYLFKVLLFDDSNETFYEGLLQLKKMIENMGFDIFTTEKDAEEVEFEEIKLEL